MIVSQRIRPEGDPAIIDQDLTAAQLDDHLITLKPLEVSFSAVSASSTVGAADVDLSGHQTWPSGNRS
jgi:hypothetical protein